MLHVKEYMLNLAKHITLEQIQTIVIICKFMDIIGEIGGHVRNCFAYDGGASQLEDLIMRGLQLETIANVEDGGIFHKVHCNIRLFFTKDGRKNSQSLYFSVTTSCDTIENFVPIEKNLCWIPCV